MEEMKDYMVRGTAAGDMIRAFSATTREMTEYCRKVHNTAPVVSAALGRLLTAGVMMGTMMKGDRDEITLKIDGDGPVQHLIVTADSHGTARGYVTNPNVELPLKGPAKLDVGTAVGNGTLSVIRDIGLGDPYVGQVTLVSGEIAEDITKYFAVSEQVPSSVALGVLVDTDLTIRQAGGFIIQLMPDCPDDVIDRLEQNLTGLPSMTQMLEDGMTPEQVLERVLEGLDLRILEKIPLEYRCTCSHDKVSRALQSISAHDLKEMVDDGKDVEVGCQFCDKKYVFRPEEIREMYVRKIGGMIDDFRGEHEA